MSAESRDISIRKLRINTGQITGLPKNPRFIRGNRFEALKRSIQDAPEMLALRELIVYPYDKEYIVIGGNMRLRACSDLGYKELPCKVLPADTPVEKLREYAVKDNLAFGSDDWDILANEWDEDELSDWGMELPQDWNANEPDDEETETNELSGKSCVKIAFQSDDDLLQFLDMYTSEIEGRFTCKITSSAK
ncbi:MAG: ParB-like nuclease domain-containing protein [Bacteroidales bacterium]|nr:ParB-like nuclease domain-containing protein [Bacteroidales bacterium]